MKFDLTLDQANLILASLAKMPYEAVFQLIEEMKKQAAEQMKPQAPAEIISEG